MTKCFRCGGTELVKGKITRSNQEYFSDIAFGPDGLRFLALTLQHGTNLRPESYACLGCGAVWSETDPNALREFIRKNCNTSKAEKN